MEQTRYKRRLKRRKRKELKELNLLNRFLFNEVLEDPVAYRAVLEIILGHNIRLKANVQSEKEIRTLPTFRGIRLDVWGQDEEDNIYNSEMQRKNTRNLPRRSRYYQSVLDAGLLEPGVVDFNQMNNVCLITIAPFDLFGRNRCMYTFRMKCDEDSTLDLDDGAARIFLNTRGTVTEGCSQELLDFLRYVEKSNERVAAESESQRLKLLHNRVRAVKSNDENEVRLMQLWEEKAYARLAGAKAKLIEQVCKKLRKGKNAQEIAEELEEDIELITRICEAARESAPEYDCDEIFEILWGEDFYDDEYEYEYEDEDVGE
ncbi:Rpn family recombination-promoting nuclease/putative transposase [Enterocloster lavalensis]|uniref:Rpn family recombination-promoting nuclease/putative transposase n=1 Tax=Enterocloster lavalensis TaxID=460384 RepID=UPI002A8321F5|nr:Rpn family recombination-promoting nuclease/putative transposase [Enterocloster lavalensis]